MVRFCRLIVTGELSLHTLGNRVGLDQSSECCEVFRI